MSKVIQMFSGVRLAASTLSTNSRRFHFSYSGPRSRFLCLTTWETRDVGRLCQRSIFVMPEMTVNQRSLTSLTRMSVKNYSTDGSGGKKIEDKPAEVLQEEPKLSIFQKFKKMYKEYWYVLIPVHCVTSAVWFGSFYYLAISGVDIVPLLEKLGASEVIIKTVGNSAAGYIAVAYGMYKIATPARYAVTLGGTTVSINYLRKWGYIKPMPSREQMTEMIKEKRIEMRSRRAKILAKMNLRRKGSNPPHNKQP